MAYAVTPSNSSLKGNYSFQLSTTKENYWSGTASVMCKNITYTFNGHGQSATTEISYGVMTFDGNGNVRVSYTDVHKFNQAASNNTVTITCNSDGTVTTYDG